MALYGIRAVLPIMRKQGSGHIVFDPDAAAGMDDYLLEVARKRRRGEWAV